MKPLKKRMLEILMLKNYSPSTQKSYVSAVAQFAQYYHQCPSLLGKLEIVLERREG